MIEVSENGWQIVATDDFNGDGRPDIVWQHPTTGNVVIWEMGGASGTDGTQWRATHTVWSEGLDPAWAVVGSGRFSGDAATDLLLQNRTDGKLVVWPLVGFVRQAGVYLPESSQANDPNYWVQATGDFNRDGQTDLIWRHQTEQRCVAYWLMSAGSAALAPPTRLASGCVAEAPADFHWQIVSPK